MIDIQTVSLSAWARTIGEDTDGFRDYWLDNHDYWTTLPERYPMWMSPGEWDQAFRLWKMR